MSITPFSLKLGFALRFLTTKPTLVAAGLVVAGVAAKAHWKSAAPPIAQNDAKVLATPLGGSVSLTPNENSGADTHGTQAVAGQAAASVAGAFSARADDYLLASMPISEASAKGNSKKVEPTPEPASIIALGLGGAALFRRRKKG